ncbi:MAG: 2-amino-4-hydroxy-6-hydroxymethyldihydropteridine diphosphokinase [Pseudomonadota bacterium]
MGASGNEGAITAFVGLGANLGDARAALMLAATALDSLPLTRTIRRSGLYRTAYVPSSSSTPQAPAEEHHHPDYLNAVVELSTRLDAMALLDELQKLEQAAGRVRPFPDAPRSLDLDLLRYGSATIQSARLTVPHPRMSLRAFVLVPLAEIAPTEVSAQALAQVGGQEVVRVGDLEAD